jgi:hypothetical protein
MKERFIMLTSLFNNKEVKQIHKAHDTNGNGVYKVFYTDDTNEITRDPEYKLSFAADKMYKSLSGLYGSRCKS